MVEVIAALGVSVLAAAGVCVLAVVILRDAAIHKEMERRNRDRQTG